MAKGGISKMAIKAMGLFGGVQVAGILCSIVRTKLVALWIGPVGMGLFGLFNQALEMLNTATNLGVRSSSVRDVSQAIDSGDRSHVARVIAVVRRWSVWLGLGGALITAALAPALSRLSFGDESHLWGFVALAAAVLLMALTNGEYAVLQGTARLRRLASVTLWGTLGGLLISVPLFYWLRERSILPSIIAYAACCAAAAWVLRDRTWPHAQVPAGEAARMGLGFVRLGAYMTAGSLVSIAASYAFSSWLNHAGGTGEVGLYQAGYTLVNKYTGLVLTALGMEYYPRLARVAGSRLRLRAMVGQEVVLCTVVMAPVVALMMVLREPVVKLLYSGEFVAVLGMVSWCLVGTVFRALSWCMSFVILAKGDGRTFLATETLSAAVGLALNVACYMHWGLDGLGMSFAAWYVVYTAIVAVVYFGHYRLRMARTCAWAAAWGLAVAVAALWAVSGGHTLAAAAVAAAAVAVCLAVVRRVWRR